MRSTTRAMMALALLLLPGLGTGAIQAGTPSYGAFSQTTRALCNMTCSDQTLDNDSCSSCANTSQVVLTETSGKLSVKNKQYLVGTIRLNLAPMSCLAPITGFNDLEAFLAMSQVLEKNIGRDVTVSGILSADGKTLMLASIAGEVYRIPNPPC